MAIKKGSKKALRNYKKTASDYFKNGRGKTSLKIFEYMFFLSTIYYLQMEISCSNYLLNGFLFTIVNILFVYSIIAVVGLFTLRRWVSALFCGAIFTSISLINYFTVLFRNQPVSTLDISNVKTAMEVMGSYKFKPHLPVMIILLLFVLSIFLVLGLKKLEVGFRGRKYFKRVIFTALLTFIFMYVTFFAPNSLKPKLTLVWSWEESYHKYGYLVSSEEMFVKTLNVVRKPEDYDETELKKIETEYKDDKEFGRKPDVILILNETFFDLSNVVDLKTDKSYMPFINGLDNAVKGYSIVPGNGGGTNRSEYELLTSNTLTLMPGITPFSFINLNDAPSIVSFLEEKGYTSWASHCAESLNYSRNTAYPKLGFDKSLFIDDFEKVGKYGKRPYATDESIYDKMIDEYNKMDKAPSLMYSLTIQNHGGWDINDASDDIIKANGNFGEYSGDVNEFLSCIKLSDSAFEKLVNYFKGVDRDVIILMVGDHSPVFAEDIANINKNDEFDKFKLYATPFVMWANFDLESENIGYTSMPYLVPLMLKKAGVKLSPFYGYMNNMFEKYPVVTSNGCYADKNKKVFYYNSADCAKEIKSYFDLVYNNASKKANRIDGLFK